MTTLFLVTGAWASSNHEIWRDEWESWQWPRETESPLELFRGPGTYVVHPKSWFVLMHLVSQISSDPSAMQAAHLIVAAAATFVFCYWGPFDWREKVCYSLGYYAVFEYGVIARNYSLGLLLLFITAAAFEVRKRSYIKLGALLFLCANTNVHASMIVSCLLGGLVLEALVDPRTRAAISVRRLDLATGVLIGATGVWLAYLQSAPPVAAPFWAGPQETGLNLDRLSWTLSLPWCAFVPIPDMTADAWWNTNFLATHLLPPRVRGILFLMSLGILAVPFALLRRNRVQLTVWATGTAGILAFAYFLHSGSLRHHGHMFILFLLCLWLVRQGESLDSTREPEGQFSRRGEPRWAARLFGLILCAQVLACSLAILSDWQRPFSNSRDAAGWIVANGWKDGLIVGSHDVFTMGIASWLEKPFYSPETRHFSINSVWHGRKSLGVSEDEVLRQVAFILTRFESKLLLVTNFTLRTGRPDLDVTLVARFDDGIVAAERFNLYEVRSARWP